MACQSAPFRSAWKKSARAITTNEPEPRVPEREKFLPSSKSSRRSFQVKIRFDLTTGPATRALCKFHQLAATSRALLYSLERVCARTYERKIYIHLFTYERYIYTFRSIIRAIVIRPPYLEIVDAGNDTWTALLISALRTEDATGDVGINELHSQLHGIWIYNWRGRRRLYVD
mgnify:CR=1 FL=1